MAYISLCTFTNFYLHLLWSCWWLIWPIQNDASNLKKMAETLARGYSSRVLGESYPISTNMTGFKCLNLCILVLWTKVALALEGISGVMTSYLTIFRNTVYHVNFVHIKNNALVRPLPLMRSLIFAYWF